MKKCPFCAEDIQDAAIKCKHCGEFLDSYRTSLLLTEKIQWYYRKPFIIIAVACVGPLALPLIWWRPHTNWRWKVGLTIGILVLTWLVYLATMASFRMLLAYYNQILGL